MKKNNKKVIILGGGLAGLAAGYELAKKGIKVVVVEKWEQVGGLARTIEINGFRFDTGPHRWYTKSNMVNKWMLDILGKEVIKVPRLTRIYFDKKFFYYPIRMMNALLGIGLGRAFQAVFDYGIARLKARLLKPKLLTMEDGYINQFGKTLYEVFFKRYSEKLWREDCKNISIDWVGQRTRGLNFITLIKETFFKSKNVVSFVDEFSYPKRGVGRLAEIMAEKIKKLKGKVYLNTEVIIINRTNEAISSIVVQKNNRKETIRGDYYISSIPITDLIKRLNPKVDHNISILTDKFRYRDELQVVLFVRKTHITPDTWIYVHPKEIPFMRLMEMDNWSDVLSPKGTTTLVFEVACNEGDAMWQKSDKEIIDLVADSYIKEFRLIEKADIMGGYVHRVPKEYPVYHIGYFEDAEKLKQYIGQLSNLQLVGRNGTFRYNNMDHSVEMGLYAAWNLISRKKKYDIESVNIEREYLEEKKIENIEDERIEDTNESQ